jgi:copper chaperone NosL
MTIVEPKHAAQLVTKKAKVFSFDAIECLLNYLKEIDQSSVALYLVSDFEQPGNLTDATRATFLVSKNIPSPMGGNLSAFKIADTGQAIKKVHGGTLYSWEELLNNYMP